MQFFVWILLAILLLCVFLYFSLAIVYIFSFNDYENSFTLSLEARLVKYAVCISIHYRPFLSIFF